MTPPFIPSEVEERRAARDASLDSARDERGGVWILVAAILLFSGNAWAHKASDSYLTLTAHGSQVGARWDIALKDLDSELDLDADGDGKIRWAEVLARAPQLQAYALGNLRLSLPGKPCPAGPATLRLTRHSDGAYAVLDFSFECPAEVHEAVLHYSLLFDVDAQHRGLVRLAGAGESWVGFSTDVRTRPIAFAEVTAGQQTWEAFVQGVGHIASGTDHLCFLFALLLPSVLRRRAGHWESTEQLRPALLEVLKVVTSFTLAHSVTLGLAAFDILHPEPKWVEVAIAASVGLAALNNLLPLLPEGRWSLAFGLGLLHGFGFVGALQDLGAAGARLWLSVVGFNLGVEAGQGAIVALFVPLAFLLRRTRLYRVGFLQVGSTAILCAATWWVSQRI